jgi:hypothetical protein
MSDKRILELLGELKRELKKHEQIDPQAATLARELDHDIHELLDPETDATLPDQALEKARSLEADFVAEHPVAAQFLRQIMDTLSKMGI